MTARQTHWFRVVNVHPSEAYDDISFNTGGWYWWQMRGASRRVSDPHGPFPTESEAREDLASKTRTND